MKEKNNAFILVSRVQKHCDLLDDFHVLKSTHILLSHIFRSKHQLSWWKCSSILRNYWHLSSDIMKTKLSRPHLSQFFVPPKVEADGSKANCSGMASSHLPTSGKYQMVLKRLCKGFPIYDKFEQSKLWIVSVKGVVALLPQTSSLKRWTTPMQAKNQALRRDGQSFREVGWKGAYIFSLCKTQTDITIIHSSIGYYHSVLHLLMYWI